MVKIQNKWKHWKIRTLKSHSPTSYLVVVGMSLEHSFVHMGIYFISPPKRMIIKEKCKFQMTFIRCWQHALSVHLILKLILKGEGFYYPHFIDAETEASTDWIKFLPTWAERQDLNQAGLEILISTFFPFEQREKSAEFLFSPRRETILESNKSLLLGY